MVSPSHKSELQSVAELQLRHWEVLQGSDVISKLYADATLKGKGEEVRNGWPIVLGSTHNDVRHIGIAFRLSQGNFTPDNLGSNYYRIGEAIGKIIVPNVALCINDADVMFVDGLLQEAQSMVSESAPHYSLESGILRF